jgi:cohesin loading factor subunit SCC2
MNSPTTSDAVTAAESLSDHRGISMSNTIHSEVASYLRLPSLPVFCGASDQDLRLFDSPLLLDRVDILSQSSKIAEMLRNTDVSYLYAFSSDFRLIFFARIVISNFAILVDMKLNS